jgi:hypothetical protein
MKESDQFITNSNRVTFKDYEDGSQKTKVYLNNMYVFDIENTDLNKKNFTLSLKQLLDHYKINS